LGYIDVTQNASNARDFARRRKEILGLKTAEWRIGVRCVLSFD
jgi:hypothetical protein